MTLPIDPDTKNSRVFRATVTIEVIVIVDPDAGDVQVHENMITSSHDDGSRGRVEFDAIVRDAVQEGDCGPGLWTVAGASTVGPIEELTP